jgi:hypothetical protein
MPWPIARRIAANPRRRVVARCPILSDEPDPLPAATLKLQQHDQETARLFARRAQERRELLDLIHSLNPEQGSENSPRLQAYVLTLSCGHQVIEMHDTIPAQRTKHCADCGNLTRTIRRAAATRLQAALTSAPCASPSDIVVPTADNPAPSAPSNPTTSRRFAPEAAPAVKISRLPARAATARNAVTH